MSETVKRDFRSEAFAIAAGDTMMLAQNEHVRVVCAMNVLLLDACKAAFAELDEKYDVDQPIDGPIKEYPFTGAGELMNRLKFAINSAERVR
jgi:hypothetical protein